MEEAELDWKSETDWEGWLLVIVDTTTEIMVMVKLATEDRLVTDPEDTGASRLSFLMSRQELSGLD